MIRIERCMFKDLGHLAAGEVATQEYPLLTDEIKPYVMEKGKEGYLAKVSARVVGHALATFDKSKSYAILDSIGVNPKFRGAGVGTKLVTHIMMSANVEGFDKVHIYVPNYAIEDKDDPWNIEHWLWRNHFKAVGVKPGCWRYGREYDWYIFERLTSVGRAKQSSQGGRSSN